MSQKSLSNAVNKIRIMPKAATSLDTSSQPKPKKIIQANYEEVNVSVENESRWRINYYSAYLKDSDFLKCYDIVWLNHSDKAQ